ncbi:GH92 family glycosyl hydrolase [Parabacteroides sp. AM08-6]|uniref:GH92 family glycosyl hydrolase n=1 Tax=Parabacteroides sp. AM08-6 TaxID=2292053 RepID=UPI000F003A5B|nr:GH92 family glycosyl hydrolase [Parabacteroides sp. AM08-6]RHJ77997.1 glycoside hydrolase family 92 protein [Parabacteroides sp. AM08-6]
MRTSLKKIQIVFFSILFCTSAESQSHTDLIRYVNPFIGTAEGKTGRATMDNAYTNPGAVCPWGMMSVSPFNIYDTENVEMKRPSPYIYGNDYIAGFTHLNMSGTGCNEMGTFCLMPTTGSFNPSHTDTSPYSKETASPGYYSVMLDKYNIKVELTTTPRIAISRYTFPKGTSNIILNMGLGLSPQKGAMIKRISSTEIEGFKMLGGICGMSSIHIVYFYAKLSKEPAKCGIWLDGRFFEKYQREVAGNDVGACFTFDTEQEETVCVKLGTSFVSTENARLNVEQEMPGFDFDGTCQKAKEAWNKELSRIIVEGGTEDDKVKFYTAMYHTLIHPNIFNDVNGEYQMFESTGVGKIDGVDRYTIFSLWDTYRNVHPFLSLVFPQQQSAMVKSLLGMYKESGFLPRWDLAGMETTAMVGDPALPVIVDSWFRGVRDFDIELAYEAMKHNATTPEKDNYMRPGMEAWLKYGYIPEDVGKLGLRGVWGSVSTAMEYCIADWNLAQLAKSLGKEEDYRQFYNRSMLYKNSYDASTGFMRPKNLDGQWFVPFDPYDKRHQEGFTEGNTWNYTYMVPHDIKGLMKLLGGPRNFVSKLDECFKKGFFDITNEPDLAYPYLYNYVKGEEWKTQKQVRKIVNEDFLNAINGLPGNDDCGTMSTWLMFAMMGFYPACPGDMEYQLTSPVFDRVTIYLDPAYYSGGKFVIEAANAGTEKWAIDKMELNGKPHKTYRINHQQIVNGGLLKYKLK